MKIYFDQQIFVQQKYGGISRYIFELSKNLNSSGQDTKILAPLHINSYIKNNSNVFGRYIGKYPKYTGKLFKNLSFMASRLYLNKPMTEKFVLHETYYSAISVAPVNFPKIITVHDMIHELYPDNFSVDDRTTEIKRKAVERANHVICISECTKKDLIHFFGVPENKISVVYHGASCLQGSEQVKVSDPFLLYVGQREGYKNFEILLRAYASSLFLKRNFKIIAFGGGDFTSSERQLMASLNITIASILHISGNDGVLKSLYQQAVALIYPSLYEGFGFPPLEAMMYNCPAIAANASCIPEITGDAALLFNPYSPDDLVEKIERVLDSDIRNQCIEKGVARHKKFTWEDCAKKTLRVYESVLQ